MQELILPQIVTIGVYNSRVAVKNINITKNRKTTMFEIEIPMENGGISYINNEEMPISQNMIICAKPGQVRHTKLPFKCYYIHFILKEGMLYDSLIQTPTFIKIKKVKKYTEIFKKLCEYNESQIKTNEIILQSLVLELVYTLICDSKELLFREKAKNSNYEIIEKVMKYIDKNPTADLSLEKMSSFAGFSPIHFHNCFKSATGMTLNKYVEEQRIKKSIDLLITTNKTLTEIAYECGFSSQSYFSYAFKRRKKLPPREYAREVFRQYDAKGE